MRDSLDRRIEPQTQDEEYLSHYAIFKRVHTVLNPKKHSPLTKREQRVNWRDLPRLSFGNVTLDTQIHRLVVVNASADPPEQVSLTPDESAFLQLMMILSRPKDGLGAVVNKEEISDWLTVIREVNNAPRKIGKSVYVPEDVSDAAVNQVLHRLRNKLESLKGCLVSIDRHAQDRLQLITKDNTDRTARNESSSDYPKRNV